MTKIFRNLAYTLWNIVHQDVYIYTCTPTPDLKAHHDSIPPAAKDSLIRTLTVVETSFSVSVAGNSHPRAAGVVATPVSTWPGGQDTRLWRDAGNRSPQMSKAKTPITWPMYRRSVGVSEESWRRDAPGGRLATNPSIPPTPVWGWLVQGGKNTHEDFHLSKIPSCSGVG